VKGKMNAAQVLANNIPCLSKREKPAAPEGNQTDRTPSTVFTVRPAEIQPSCGTESNTFYDNLKPFIFVMRAMGVCPVRISSKGKDIHVGFVVDNVALGQGFLRVLRFSPVNIIPPSLSKLISSF
jgi:hypothetical protein